MRLSLELVLNRLLLFRWTLHVTTSGSFAIVWPLAEERDYVLSTFNAFYTGRIRPTWRLQSECLQHCRVSAPPTVDTRRDEVENTLLVRWIVVHPRILLSLRTLSAFICGKEAEVDCSVKEAEVQCIEVGAYPARGWAGGANATVYWSLAFGFSKVGRNAGLWWLAEELVGYEAV